ncbi:MAG: hypothetical protein ACLFTH_00670 [Candidatus Woesearchaeota archaeon]
MGFSDRLSCFFFLFLFSLVLASSQTGAIGVSPAVQTVEYVENETVAIELLVTGLSNDVELSASGALSDFITFSDDVVEYSGSKATIDINITFPPYDQIDIFGEQKSYIRIRELPEGNSGLSATTAVNPTVKVYIPNPGLYAEIEELSVPTINEGEDTYYSFKIKNRGTDNFSGQEAVLKVTDMSGQTVDTFTITDVAASPDGFFEAEGEIPSSSYEPGKYTAEVVFDLDPDRSPFVSSTSFFVGTTDVVLVNYTDTVTADSINKVDLELQSLWGSPLEGIRASVDGLDGGEQSLPVIDFEPFENKVVTAFVDVPSTNKTSFNSSLVLEFPEDIASEPSKTVPLHFDVKQEDDTGSIFSLTTTTALVGIITVLVIVILVLWLSSRKKAKKRGG